MGRKENESAEVVRRNRLARLDRSDLTVKQRQNRCHGSVHDAQRH